MSRRMDAWHCHFGRAGATSSILALNGTVVTTSTGGFADNGHPCYSAFQGLPCSGTEFASGIYQICHPRVKWNPPFAEIQWGQVLRLYFNSVSSACSVSSRAIQLFNLGATILESSTRPRSFVSIASIARPCRGLQNRGTPEPSA